jgi:hypothetical protein
VRLPLRASRDLDKRLDAITSGPSQFVEIPRRERGNSWSGGMTEDDAVRAIRVEPRCKAEVIFLEWTRGFLRHAQVKTVLTD